MVEAICRSDALKIYVCNIMTQEGETEGYTVSDHIAAIFAHSAQGLFRLCLTNSSPIPKAVAARYAEEGAERIRCDKSACAALGVEVLGGLPDHVEDGDGDLLLHIVQEEVGGVAGDGDDGAAALLQQAGVGQLAALEPRRLGSGLAK